MRLNCCDGLMVVVCVWIHTRTGYCRELGYGVDHRFGPSWRPPPAPAPPYDPGVMPGRLGESRIQDPRYWGRARERRTAWLLRGFGAWRWVVVRYRPWAWSLAWYASWDLRTPTSWARCAARALRLDRLKTRLAWVVVRIVRHQYVLRHEI